MGREIRMVPKGWKHPENERCSHWGGIDCHKKYAKPTDYHYGKCFKPMFDENYEERARRWLNDCIEYSRISTESGISSENREEFYWDYEDMPPEKEYYVPYKQEDCTCFQMYETVSEGTPVSPVFDTKQEMIDWLIVDGHSEKSAKAFVESGWAPSMIVKHSGNKIDIKSNIEIYD